MRMPAIGLLKVAATGVQAKTGVWAIAGFGAFILLFSVSDTGRLSETRSCDFILFEDKITVTCRLCDNRGDFAMRWRDRRLEVRLYPS